MKMMNWKMAKLLEELALEESQKKRKGEESDEEEEECIPTSPFAVLLPSSSDEESD